MSDTFQQITDRFYRYWKNQTSSEFVQALSNLRNFVESGGVEGAGDLAEVLALEGPHFNPAEAYKWYYVALSQEGYLVDYKNEYHDLSHYCGPIGDFRNESMVSGLIDILGLETIRKLDEEAAAWLQRSADSSSIRRNVRRRSMEYRMSESSLSLACSQKR